MPIIRPDEKYAMVVLPNTILDENLPVLEQLADDLWFCTELPFEFPERWVEWIGTVKAEKLKRGSLFLIAKGPSKKPEIMDEENELYKRRAGSLYWALILSGFIFCYDQPFSIMGAVRNEEPGMVRSVGEFAQPHVLSWMDPEKIDLERLSRATRYAVTIPEFEGPGKFDRFSRVMQAFHNGIISHNPLDSLHQFVRCIEGFVYPDKGVSTSQFKSRTELFLGPKFHEMAGELYEIRSKVEHLHDPASVVQAKTERERRTIFLVRATQAEALARYCIQRLLEKPELRVFFETDEAIIQFWKLSPTERCQLWGEPMEINAVERTIKRDLISDSDLGLNKTL